MDVFVGLRCDTARHAIGMGAECAITNAGLGTAPLRRLSAPKPCLLLLAHLRGWAQALSVNVAQTLTVPLTVSLTTSPTSGEPSFGDAIQCAAVSGNQR